MDRQSRDLQHERSRADEVSGEDEVAETKVESTEGIDAHANTSGTARGAEQDRSLDAMRRDFLYNTARTLTLSRIRAAREMLRVFDEIGVRMTELESTVNEMQTALQGMRGLHTSLKLPVAEELRCSVGAILRHSFDVQEPEVLLPFSACVDKVVEMFMVDFSRDEHGE